jgi:hypothetical protein|tara:strand:- start:6 stop:116 length:111 start_codon:yes stop_codon:yes gene_type:complete
MYAMIVIIPVIVVPIAIVLSHCNKSMNTNNKNKLVG